MQEHMLKYALVFIGFILLVIQYYIVPVSDQAQVYLFIGGIILLGIPHGAADVLVGTDGNVSPHKSLSAPYFLAKYAGRLFIFWLIIYWFPLTGIFLFVIFSAYHFGETDLHQFDTKTLSGKLFVFSYGLVILCVIIMQHFTEVMPLLDIVTNKTTMPGLSKAIQPYKLLLLSISGLFFFFTAFIHLYHHSVNIRFEGILVRFCFIIVILYYLPLMLGFTFYFIVWHSVLSMQMIFTYLQSEKSFAKAHIALQMIKYSLLAFAALSFVGYAGYQFSNRSAFIVYIFLGLAVLTAPHMQVMYNMYNKIRSKKGSIS
jgi:beta-carotene 15,15'-dioxygenase